MSKRLSRSIICEICSQPRRVARQVDVCNSCTHKMTKISCGSCARLVNQLEPISGHCHRCAKRVSKVEIVCERCGLSDYPYIRDVVHCRKCHRSTVKRSDWRKSLPRTVACLICGETKASWKKKEQVCQACDNKRRNSN